MSTQTLDQAPTAGALASQASFEAMFPVGYTPKIDIRTPAMVREQAQREGWK